MKTAFEQIVYVRVLAAMTVFALAGLSVRAANVGPTVLPNGVSADVRVAAKGRDTPDSALAREVLNRAIRDASLRLQRRECAAFFGPGANERLTTAEYKLLSLGAPRFENNEPV